jgi:glycosyltransferase involved in cell wall biosynthesis
VRVVVIRTGRLFAHDEPRLYADRLCHALVDAGHSVELTTIPFSGAIAGIVPESTAYRLLDLRRGVDVCIGIGPFTHALQHPNKRLWVFSQYSPFYEHWDTPFGAVTASPTNLVARDCVRSMDRTWMSEAARVCAASPLLAEALAEQHGVQPRVVMPGLLEDFAPVSDGPGDEYFLASGPLTDSARIALQIDAYGRSKSTAGLVILGFENTLEEREYVQQLIRESPRAPSIRLEVDPSYNRFRQLLSAAAGFIAVPFRAPVADVFAVSAGAARVAVVTAKDSGALARLIDDGVDGFAVEPDAGALAQAMDQLHSSRKLAARFGERLAEKLRGELPSWESIAEEFTK